MLEFDVDTDKLIKPITKAVEGLKRAKDPGLREVLKDLDKQVEGLEKASKGFAKSKPVVDEKTFEEKKKQVETFNKACQSAKAAVEKVKDLPVHGADSKGTSRGSVEVKDVPKNARKPKVADLPVVGDQLEELHEKLSAAISRLEKDFAGFQSSFIAGSKDASLEVKVPKGMTNMIEFVGNRGTINLPDEQAFEATVTFDGITNQTAQSLGNFQKEFFGEVGRALEPLKKQVAKAFKDWNDEFEQIEREFDKNKAKKLSESINDYFKAKLPKFIEQELQTAAMKALTEAVPKGQESLLRNVKASIQANYSSFSVFEITFPEKPGGLGKAYKDAESARQGLDEAAIKMGESYGEVQESTKKLQAAIAKDNKDVDSKDVQKAIENLESAVGDADSARQSLAEQLGPANKRLHDHKDALKDNPDIRYDELTKGLDRTLRGELKDGTGSISKTLKQVTETIDSARKLLTSFDGLHGRKGEAPDQKKADAFKTELDKFVKGLTLKPADLKLEIKFDFSLLKSAAEKLKD